MIVSRFIHPTVGAVCLTNERNATLLNRCSLHLKSQIVKVLQRLYKALQLLHDEYFSCRNQSPCLLEA